MRNGTLERLATGTAAGLAAVVLAGGAGAAIRPDDRETRGPGAIAAAQRDVVVRPDDRETRGPGAVAASQRDVVVRPDDRETRGPGALAASRRDTVVRPDDRADRHLPIAVPMSQPTTAEAFDWVDAGIGSAATLGIVLLVAGASVVVLRNGARTA